MNTLAKLLGASALTLVGTAAAAEKWDMPMAYSATNFHSETGAAFAACVTEGTMGELEIVTHPSGSLYGGAEIKRAVQTGQAPIGERILSAHQNENPLYGIDSIPFLVSSFDEHEAFWKIAGPKVAEVLEEDGLVYLYSVPWPPQGLYFDRPIESVSEMEGIKFRSYNTATARMAELTGMLPVQVEAAELSQALATGVAEAFISSGATGYDRKVWEHLTNFYEVDAWLPRNAVFVNEGYWNDLDAATQATLRECAAQAKADGLQASRDYTQFTLDGLREGGMTVQPAGDQLVSELREIGAIMAEEWIESAGPEGAAIIEEYRASN